MNIIWGGCVGTPLIIVAAIPFSTRLQKDVSLTGIEPLTFQPQSETVTAGPPWQLYMIFSYLSHISSGGLAVSLTVAVLPVEAVAVAAEPYRSDNYHWSYILLSAYLCYSLVVPSVWEVSHYGMGWQKNKSELMCSEVSLTHCLSLSSRSQRAMSHWWYFMASTDLSQQCQLTDSTWLSLSILAYETEAFSHAIFHVILWTLLLAYLCHHSYNTFPAISILENIVSFLPRVLSLDVGTSTNTQKESEKELKTVILLTASCIITICVFKHEAMFLNGRANHNFLSRARDL